MPTLTWLQKEFSYGYDSGDVLSLFPGKIRRDEEQRAGGSYRKIAHRALRPYLKNNSRVLELGPGKGSWSRAILKFVPDGELRTVDFQDVRGWLKPEEYSGRLVCHQVSDNTFSCVPDGYFDLFWSFGVLCHNNLDAIKDILMSARRKMKRGGWAIHQYGDWEKLDRYGWRKGGVPEQFRSQSDQEIWWPRNDRSSMTLIAKEAGWDVVAPDMELLERDSIVLLQNPKGE